MEFSKPSDGRSGRALTLIKYTRPCAKERPLAFFARGLSVILVISTSLIVAFAGCSTISQESLLVEAGTHQFPRGETPWEPFDRQLKSQGFLDLESARQMPGVPKRLRPPKNAKNPKVYVGLAEDRSYTLLAVSTPRNFITATAHIHAHGSKSDRRAYIQKSLNWLESLVADLVEINPYGKPEALDPIHEALANY